MKRRVYLLAIRHDHGINLDAFATEEERTAGLLAYVESWWSDVEEEVGPMPDEPGLAIDTYFDNHDSEWYEETERDIEFPE